MTQTEGAGSLRIRIDAGHGGADPGAVGNRIREAELNLELAKLVAASMRGVGVHVDMTRTTDEAITATERTRRLIIPGVACSVSIHGNYFGDPRPRGHEVYVSAFDAESRRLGQSISDQLTRWMPHIPPRNPPVRTRLASGGTADYFYVIRQPVRAGIPAVLVECGFLSNPEDAAVLREFWGRFAIAHAISRGIAAWAGLDDICAQLEQELARTQGRLG